MLLDVDEAPGDLLEQHRAFSVKSWRAIAEPPLNVACRICASIEGVQRALHWDSEGLWAGAEPGVGVRHCSLHGSLRGVVESARRRLDVQNERSHVLSATLVGDRLENAVAALDPTRFFVAKDLGSVRLQRLYVSLQCLHHPDRLHLVDGINGDGILCHAELGVRVLRTWLRCAGGFRLSLAVGVDAELALGVRVRAVASFVVLAYLRCSVSGTFEPSRSAI